MGKQSVKVAHPDLVSGEITSLHSHSGIGGNIITEYSESENDSTTTSTSWQNKLTHTVETPGTYLIQWYFEFYGTSGSYHARTQVQHNTTQIANLQNETKDPSPASWDGGGGIKKLTLLQGDTIKINFCSENASGTAHIRYARIALIKIS